MGGLVIVRGLPGSGITKLAEKVCHDGGFDLHFEDNMFFDGYKPVPYFPNIPLAMYECRVQTFSALARGYDVVVSNYFIKYKELFPYVLMSILLTEKNPTVMEPQHSTCRDITKCVERTSRNFNERHLEKMRSDWQKCTEEGWPEDPDISDELDIHYSTQLARAWAVNWTELHGKQRLALMKSICSG